MINLERAFRAGLLIAALLGPAGAHAATSGGTLSPSITISTFCSVATTALDFGNVPNLNGPRSATATVSVTCSTGAVYSVGLGPGVYGGSVTTRRMKHTVGPELVDYGIFQDPARTQNWGNTPGTDTFGGAGSGAAQTYTAHGRTVAGQTGLPNGSYTDTVQVIVTY